MHELLLQELSLYASLVIWYLLPFHQIMGGKKKEGNISQFIGRLCIVKLLSLIWPKLNKVHKTPTTGKNKCKKVYCKNFLYAWKEVYLVAWSTKQFPQTNWAVYTFLIKCYQPIRLIQTKLIEIHVVSRFWLRLGAFIQLI